MKLIYLASPYSHKDLNIIEERVNKINKLCARLLNKGINVFSPISHSHEIQKTENLPHTWDFWKDFDIMFLERCDELWVFKQKGWETSKGVKAEIEIAKKLNLRIKYLEDF